MTISYTLDKFITNKYTKRASVMDVFFVLETVIFGALVYAWVQDV